jgi:hypothetical protein
MFLSVTSLPLAIRLIAEFTALVGGSPITGIVKSAALCAARQARMVVPKEQS